MDLQLAEKKVLDALTEEFDNVPFTPKRFRNGESNMLEITCENVNLHGVYDNIFLSFGLSEFGIVFNSMIFDTLLINEENLKLVNDVNRSQAHYKAYVNGAGFFVLESSTSVQTEDDYARLAIQFMRRGQFLANDDAVKAVVKKLIKE